MMRRESCTIQQINQLIQYFRQSVYIQVVKSNKYHKLIVLYISIEVSVFASDLNIPPSPDSADAELARTWMF